MKLWLPFKLDKERGQTIVLLAVAMIALIAAVGLTTDVALLYVAKARLQRAVDASAIAAANKLPDQDEARRAAYEFTRLHGYDFAPGTNPLQINFPIENPPRKLALVAGTVDVDLAFLRIIGREQAQVSAEGMGESAPLDVYLVLDLSHSMIYDTPRPWWWYDYGDYWWTERRKDLCLQTGCGTADCNRSDSESWYYCRAYYCNHEGWMNPMWGFSSFYKSRNCDPLDMHIKDSAKFFVDQLDSRYDRIGVITYDVEGSRAITLTTDFDAVKNTIDNLDAYLFPGGAQHLCTNIGDGLMYVNHYIGLTPPELGGEGGRMDSVWAAVLLTDGRANRYRDCSGCPPDCDAMPDCQVQYCDPWTGYCVVANDWARDNAWVSWGDHKLAVFTIAYGDIFFDYPQYREVMIDIADITDNGTVDSDSANFWAVPDESGLRAALEEIAERIYTRLVR